MFGPLNGVRVALVALAAAAALFALFLGEWLVAAVLLLGVGVHGLGWWFLYRQHTRAASAPAPAGKPGPSGG